MFDTIEIEIDIENGPQAGEYQTKDLECVMDNYIIENKKLFRKAYKFNKIQPENKKYMWHMFSREFVGLVDTEFHGWIELYGAYDTWRIKFTDGELMECKLMENFEPEKENEELEEEEYAGHIGIPDHYFDNNEREVEFDEDDYEG